MQLPQQINQLTNQLNEIYNGLDQIEEKVTKVIQTQRFQPCTAQQLTKLKQQVDSAISQQSETFKALLMKLEAFSNDRILVLNQEQRSLLQVQIQRYRSSIQTKQATYKDISLQLAKLITMATEEQKNQEQKQQHKSEEEQKKQQQLEAVQDQLDQHQAELDRDQKLITENHKQINEIVEIIDTISNEIDRQGQMVNDIEHKTFAVDVNMDKGMTDMINASKEQDKNKKFKWWLIIGGIILAIIVVIVILVAIFG